MASSNVAGYEYEFLEPYAKLKEFECPLCLYVTREPHLTDCCGQHFCQACINHIITDRKPCPFCKAKGFVVIFDKKQKRRVLELKVKCTMKELGCDWNGELENLDTHIDTQRGSCQFVDVNCSNNCGENLQRGHLAKHLSDLCPKRPFTCQYCKLEATYEQVCNDHYPKCMKYPVPCPNKCEIGTIERGKLKQHVSECPLQMVECEFAHAGCCEKLKRRDLPKHMEVSIQKHLTLVSVYSVKEVAQKDEQLTQLQRKLAEKDKEVEVLLYALKVVNCLVPIEFTVANYSQYEGSFRTVEGPVLCTAPKTQIKFYYFMSGRVEVDIWTLLGETDDMVKWPVKCTVTATLLNQSSDQHHVSRSQDYVLSRPTEERRIYPSVLHVDDSTINNRSQQHRRYLKDDNLIFRFVFQLN